MAKNVMYRLSPCRSEAGPVADVSAQEWRALLAKAGLDADSEHLDRGAVRQFSRAVEDAVDPEVRAVLDKAKWGLRVQRVLNTEVGPPVERAPSGPGALSVRVVEREDLVFV